MRWWQNIEIWYYRVFNIKFAIISAVFNGGVVMVMNREYGFAVLLRAGTSQAVSSFFSTGVTARIVQHFSPIKNPMRSYALGSMIPAIMTLIMSLGAHLLNHTPKPLWNAVPATLVSLITSFGTNFITRRGHLRSQDYPL